MKKERKQEIKTEPMNGAEKVQEKANRDTLKRAGDVANFIFDLKDGKTHHFKLPVAANRNFDYGKNH